MKLAEIDFSPYTQLRNMRLVDFEGNVCFIGACAAAQGFGHTARFFYDDEGKELCQREILSRLEDLPKEIPEPLLCAIWVMNDRHGKTFEEIRKFVLWAVS